MNLRLLAASPRCETRLCRHSIPLRWNSVGAGVRRPARCVLYLSRAPGWLV